jgi:hypothetical protein
MPDQTAPPKDCTEMGAVVDAHRKLEPFVGVFAAKVSLWMGPEPMVSTGVMTNRWDLGGRFLHQSYKGDQTDGPFPGFEGRGYWGYNTVARRFEGFWIDTASTIMQTESGEVDRSGKVWTMVGSFPDPASGKPIRKRSVITLIDRTRHTMECYFQGPDGRESKTMAIEYARRA